MAKFDYSKATKFNVLKGTEGGISQRNLRDNAAAHGFDQLRFDHSSFVAHYGVWIPTKDRRKVDRFMSKVLHW